jgi:hypothetical protein
MRELQNGNMKIEEYGLVDFLESIQSSFKEGFILDFSTNETYPNNFGTMYSVLMVPEKAKAIPALLKPKVEPKTETQREPDTQDETPAPKRGRPKVA